MFDHIRGTLAAASPHRATVDVGGVGYLIEISLATFAKLPAIGQEVRLYTTLVVREDSQKLFGFLATQERDCFATLCSISGIGPRLSLSILGHISLVDLHVAVERGDAKALTQIPGIGKKMADRLILELKDKLEKTSEQRISHAPEETGLRADAARALIGLGYRPAEAEQAIGRALEDRADEPPLAELISLALKARSR